MSESPKLNLGNGRILSATPIMALQAELRIEVRALRPLRGPDLNDVVPPATRPHRKIRRAVGRLPSSTSIRARISPYAS